MAAKIMRPMPNIRGIVKTKLEWHADSGKEICKFIGDYSFTASVIMSDSITAGDSSGRVHFLKLEE